MGEPLHSLENKERCGVCLVDVSFKLGLPNVSYFCCKSDCKHKCNGDTHCEDDRS
jgi:hypothetical protein